jgi:hypothetical protein
MGFTPNELDRGILLERGGLLIPWGTRIDGLSEVQSPSILQRDDSIHYTWKDELCFDGLPCNVSACRIFGRTDLLAYHLYLEEFHFAVLDVIVAHVVRDIATEFRRVFRHLEHTLGAPTWSYPRYEAGLPSIHWEFLKLSVGYSLLAGEIRLSVQHEPEGYRDLKRRAKRKRDLDAADARVDGIAW